MSTYKRLEEAETVHHLYVAHLKGYESNTTYDDFRERYQECVRILNGLERTLEKQLPEQDRRWPESVRENGEQYGDLNPVNGYTWCWVQVSGTN